MEQQGLTSTTAVPATSGNFINAMFLESIGQFRCFVAFLVLATVGLAATLDTPTYAADQRQLPEQVEFNRDIRPILSERCFTCHGPDAGSREADLRLDQREAVIEASVIVPGEPDDSEVWARMVSDDDDYRMPPPDAHKSELTSVELELVRRWIQQGAPYQQHWSLTPLRRPAIPVVKNTTWCVNPIDRFIVAEQESRNLRPSSRADLVTLVRRAHLDLIGLPPSPDDVSRFEQDERSNAYPRLVDRLLASPAFGERLAIYWLDLVRFANSVGYHGDQEHAIDPYREYVIAAFNHNMPFDQFTREQLAGDLLPEATIDQLIASGYNRLLQTSHEGGVQPKEYIAKYDADRVRNVASTWMGATMGCAECHDHKYDAYTQRDFYRLAAFFADVDDSQTFRGSNSVLTERKPELEVLSQIDRELIRRYEQEFQRLSSGDVANEDRENTARFRMRIDEIGSRKQRTMITVAVEPRTIRVLERGDWMDETGEVVGPGVPACLPPLRVKVDRPTRLDLADWLTSADHPQTARVFVNRLWYLFMGTGISRDLEDSGSQGHWPTHPQLVDWLACEFIESGWDVKHIVRLIVTSQVYQQASRVRSDLADSDPENTWYTRANRHRLSAELVRDSILSISGQLVLELGGRASRPPQPAGYYVHLNFPQRKYHADAGKNGYRRGVYMHWQRQYLHPMLKAFDAPSREECTASRAHSNTPQAALTMLNDPSVVHAAIRFAARIIDQGGRSDRERIAWAWRQATSRPAGEATDVLLPLLEQHRQQYAEAVDAASALVALANLPERASADAIELAAWSSVARTILNLNEVITRN